MCRESVHRSSSQDVQLFLTNNHKADSYKGLTNFISIGKNYECKKNYNSSGNLKLR